MEYKIDTLARILLDNGVVIEGEKWNGIDDYAEQYGESPRAVVMVQTVLNNSAFFCVRNYNESVILPDSVREDVVAACRSVFQAVDVSGEDANTMALHVA